MPNRPVIRIETLQKRWRESPLKGGLLGIVSVALATAVIGVACAAMALVVTLIY